MDHHLVVRIIIVMEARLVLTQNKIGLKADYVVEESAELVNLRADNDVGARVFNQVFLVTQDLILKSFTLLTQVANLIAEL